MTSDRRQQGFSLIEAMVALLIIAVGLLGIAGMQGLSMNSTSTSRMRALAAVEASNMAAYIGANASFWQNPPSASPGAGYNVTVTPGSTVTISDSSLNNLNNVCTQGSCTTVQMAAYDLKQWGSASQLGLLPSGVGAVTCGAQGTCTVTVGWSQKEMAGDATSSALAPAVTYFRMVVQP